MEKDGLQDRAQTGFQSFYVLSKALEHIQVG
jgi:hypothetical protein